MRRVVSSCLHNNSWHLIEGVGISGKKVFEMPQPGPLERRRQGVIFLQKKKAAFVAAFFFAIVPVF
jgi:hypothetical protein